ncbi:MAG: ATP synthase F1 subunit delta [Bacteroidia bacterium]
MSQHRISQRYAKALLEFSLEKNELEEIRTDVQDFLKLTRENRDFRLLLESPVIDQDKKKQILNRILEGKINNILLRFIHQVLTKKREELLAGIFNQFLVLYNERMGIAKATLFTAVPIDEKLHKQISEMLQQGTNRRFELDAQVQEDMIGGFILRYDDKLVDSSIKTRLKELKLHLAN